MSSRSRSEQLAALAARNAVAAVYKGREFAAAGGLLSYGTDIADTFRLAGIYTCGAGPSPSLAVMQQSVANLRRTSELIVAAISRARLLV